ncbi:MAG TPA: serine/threonine protein phosphatase [Verrucomicrobiales bacterium]|jgi:tRNA A-37 threonylcarbamoyl transferase component Bud32|nr:serine/threonine protein phosphatase [Akkermansiaceae bacterium]HCC21424.1 serine/threonine protein phosphatase [Verrucomicrobiales bacterium]HCI91587.1 serine/threonine protein phosphatase [Verrucomicrobiales bacterium]HCL97399.1 serine/threonine protein phosphatase [Verrucomicrobiales bacterium]|tara:strand:- start:1469 stop:1858 length:390 start_codon:yes stop_codon:yes gene_type:complete
MRPLKDGIRSLVKIDFYGNVHKYFRGTDKETRFATEIRILKSLEERGCKFVPKYIDSNESELHLVTSNCGAPAPDVSQKKCDQLFAKLETEFGVRHDDPFPRNVTYDAKIGQFCVIDFELATLLDQPSP